MREYMKRATRIMEDGEEAMGSSAVKKRKLYSELGNGYCGEVELKDHSTSVSSSASRNSDCCSKRDESSDVVRNSLRSPDLENVGLQSEGYEAEISTSVNDIFREATPTSELCGESEQAVSSLMESSHNSKKKSSPALLQAEGAEKTPSAEEVEEFLAAAEKKLQKGFAEKYNYDIVKDIPLEGRYQWVRLKH